MNLGFPEMLFLFFLALIIFGPKRLPEIGRQIGKGLAEFKRASSEFQAQIHDEVRKLELETELKNTIAPSPQQSAALQNTVAYTPPGSALSSDTTSVHPPTLDGDTLSDGVQEPAGSENSGPLPEAEKSVSARAVGDSGNRADA